MARPPEPGLGPCQSDSLSPAAAFLPGDYEYEQKGITNFFLMLADRAAAGAIDNAAANLVGRRGRKSSMCCFSLVMRQPRKLWTATARLMAS
jgi:hypothetical protein